MGLKEIEQKMMDTLSTYAKIQAVQGLIMALMPNQAAVLVGFDKGKRERELFFLIETFTIYVQTTINAHALKAAAPAIFLVGLLYIGMAMQYSYGAHCESRYVYVFFFLRTYLFNFFLSSERT
jgi:hypothetical protein